MQKINILIVDDDPVNLLILDKMLERPDLKIVRASSGLEAIEQAREVDFALALIDVQMPNMTGFETAKKIRLTRLNKELPVIFVSAISKGKQFVHQGYETGAVDYLIKPINKSLLSAKVDVFRKLHEQKKQLETKNRELAKVNQQLQREIAERESISEKLKESETKYRKLFEKSNDAILITDKTKIIDCNAALVRLFGFEKKAVVMKRTYVELFPNTQPDGETSKEKIQKMMDTALKNGGHKFECVSKKYKRRTFPAEILMTVIPMGKKKIFHTVVRDITKRKRSEEKLISQAMRDPLTKLFNRRYLEESLDREVSKAERDKSGLAVIMLDADHFKRFNDTYGHLAGDTVLREMGELLVQYSRREDIACRYGGEEFVLVLPGTTIDVAIQRAEDLRETIEKRKKITHENQDLPNVTISLGVAVMPDHANTSNQLLNAADLALYEAKNKGRNRVEIAERPQ